MGQLARIVATFVANNQPAQLSQANVRAEIARLFMSVEEVQHVRASLTTIYQKPYQDVKSYGKAFALTTQRAYYKGQRTLLTI